MRVAMTGAERADRLGAPPRWRPTATTSLRLVRPAPGRRPTPWPGTPRAAPSTPPASTASTPWSTWPEPASATSAGPTPASRRSWRAAPAAPGCWPARSPRSTPRRRCWCRARPSASTATGATRSSPRTSGPGGGFLAERRRRLGSRPAAPAAAPASARRRSHRHRARTGAGCSARCCRRSASGGRAFGSGRQWMSWITLADEVAAIGHLLDHGDVAGPVNLTSPQPVTNRDFAAALGRALHRPALVPVPASGPACCSAARWPTRCCSSASGRCPRRSRRPASGSSAPTSTGLRPRSAAEPGREATTRTTERPCPQPTARGGRLRLRRHAGTRRHHGAVPGGGHRLAAARRGRAALAAHRCRGRDEMKLATVARLFRGWTEAASSSTAAPTPPR